MQADFSQDKSEAAPAGDDPKIVAFLCTWCSYAGADLAGTGRNQYPPNIRVIRVPCSGRINPLYIIKALIEGADGVMVSGCHPGDCHYLVGNYHARRRFTVLKKLLAAAGFEQNRVHFTWVSASEGSRFADVVKDITKKVLDLGPSPFKSDFVNTHFIDLQLQSNDYCKNETEQYTSFDRRSSQVNFSLLQAQIVQHCREQLEAGIVNTVIGYKHCEDTGNGIPCFIDSSICSDELIWNNRCISNLAGYLLEQNGKTAIVAKPCDARAVVCFINENQLKRDDVYIIGITCFGMINSFNEPLPGCLDCKVNIPPVYDFLIDVSLIGSYEPVIGTSQSSNYSSKRFISEINKCILCFSCRQSCYGCYCNTCFIDRTEPDWQTGSPDFGKKMLYHLGRSNHLSGRCVECGACENACASGVDIRYLIRSVSDFIENTYDYRAGMSFEADPAMLSFKIDDSETGFLGFSDPEYPDIAGGYANE